jgi:predicted dehydrogenase
MNMKPIKTGILSFGMSGKVFHAPFLHLHPGFELCAVTERHAKTAASIYPDIVSYDSVAELLADDQLELIVVNTPNDTHVDYVLKALKAGKHVLVEKPFATSSEEAKMLFEEARMRHLCLLPYQNRRFDSDFTSVQKVIASGQLGKLVEVHIRFDRYRPQIGLKVFKETPIPGSGLLYDLGPHLLDQALYLFGNPLRWTKTLGFNREKTQVDDFFHIHLEYPEGLQVFVTANMLITDTQPAYVLHGSKGSYVKQRTDVQENQLVAGMRPENPLYGLEESGGEGILTTVSPEGQFIRQKMEMKQTSYTSLFDAVYRSIRFGEAFIITEEQIIQQLIILES